MSGQVPWARAVEPAAALHPLPAAAGVDLAPAWARELAGPEADRLQPALPAGESGVDRSASLAIGAGFALAEIVVPDAAALPADRLAAMAEEAYRAVRSLAEACGRRYPLRFWNLIPAINEPLALHGRSRYMVFNTGRFAALTAWLGGPGGRCWAVPTATGVGGRSGEMRVACLLGREPGLPLENPRQRPSYRYDSRYGPRPPCFSRATVVTAPGGRLLLIGGTASVRGQHSVHGGLLGRQFDETCRNLGALLGQARTGTGIGLGRVPFRHLRAYVPRQEDLPDVECLLRATFGKDRPFEVVSLDLCRPELLVELEGVVELKGALPG